MAKKKQTGRNIMVYVPNETAARMSELKEVNWSQICRGAIETYVEKRKSVNPAALLRLEEIKQAEEKDGYIFGSQFASDIVKELNYDQVYNLRWNWLDPSEEDLWYDEPNWMTDWLRDAVGGERYVADKNRKKWLEEFDKRASEKGSLAWVLKLAEKKKGLRKNPRFFQGMITALREILA
jgi:hypothetical protein